MSPGSDEAIHFIRASRMTPLTYLCAWALFLGVLFVGAGTMPFVAVGGALLLFAVVPFVAHSSLAGVRLDATGVSARGIFRRRRLEWVDVRSVRIEHLVDRAAARHVVRFLDAREREVIGLSSIPLLVDGSARRFQRFFSEHGIDVPVNPPSDPRVRFEQWRPALDRHDPFESIRTVRRAVVGPYVVMVRPQHDRFVALTIDERTDEQLVVSDDRADLASAIEAAIDQIHDARRRHAAEE